MDTMLPLSLLSQLPPAPKGKNGWPWTKESPILPPFMPNGVSWPKISIVTPSFNQGEFIEETIRSVLLQNYPNLEYIIIDGGSNDNSVEIIKKYEPWLSYWVSEKDRGQSHAINKGFDLCTGDIFNWLCSDDVFLKNTFHIISGSMLLTKPSWKIGNAYVAIGSSNNTNKLKPIDQFGIKNLLLWSEFAIHQPSIFWNQKLHQLIPKVDESLHYCMDVDLWLKFYLIADPSFSDAYLSRSLRHIEAKTSINSLCYDKYQHEFARWRLDNIYRSNNEKILNELEEILVLTQNKLNTLNRLKSHIIIGNIIILWKKIINKNLPI